MWAGSPRSNAHFYSQRAAGFARSVCGDRALRFLRAVMLAFVRVTAPVTRPEVREPGTAVLNNFKMGGVLFLRC